MLALAVYSNGQLAKEVNISGAYLIGTDDVPLRAEISFGDGIIRCKKRAAGPAGLVLLWKVRGVGSVLTESVRLQEREKPYVLQVELARGRLMRITQKLDDWGLNEYEGMEKIIGQVNKSRDVLIKALQADSPAEAAALGEEALTLAVQASEAMSHFHADIFLARRMQTGGFPKRVFGCSVNLGKPADRCRRRLTNAFDFVTLPIGWRDIEPNEQTFNWKPFDTWVETLTKSRLSIQGAPLLSFDERHVPDWLYIWEHDFDTIRDLAFEHVRRVINRYGQYVQAWHVIAGIHANCCFAFNFEQLMELTRMAAAVTRQLAPRSVAIVDLVAPWGEYYARNQRTIPPLLYADMVVQSGVDFDAFGLQFHFGPRTDGMFVRDMFQVSSLLDLFAKLGKPLHISAAGVPSAMALSGDAIADGRSAGDGGEWHGTWSEEVQSNWLREFFCVTMSKPFVESLSWHSLADDDGALVPHGGLLHADLSPKVAYHQFAKLRSEVLAASRRRAGESGE